MQMNNDEIKMSPETAKVFRDVFQEAEVESWSIGKLKAFLESRGIRAAKIKRPMLEIRARRILEREAEAAYFDKQKAEQPITELNKAVKGYKAGNRHG